MIRLQASFALAVALIALGAAQASAELITIDASTTANGTNVTTIDSTVSGLPDSHIYVVWGEQANPFDPTYQTIVSLVGGVKVLAGVASPSPNLITTWTGGDWVYGTGVALRVDFVPDVTDGSNVDLGGLYNYPDYPTNYSPIDYVEVDFRTDGGSTNQDVGLLQAWDKDGNLLKERTISLASGETETVAIDRVADGLLLPIAYITATGYPEGISVFITGVRYGTGPDPVLVPEPTSLACLLLGGIGIVLFRKRAA